MNEPSTPDTKLADDEARRGMQHDAVKSQVEGNVNSEIAARAAQAPAAGNAQKIGEVAGTFREHAVDEVIDRERDVRRSRGTARVSQFIDYIFFLIYALLGIRLLLSLIAARSSAGFVQFIVNITNPLYAPFKGIVSSPRTEDGHTLVLPLVVALGAYLVLHIVINRTLRLVVNRKTEV